MSTIFGLIVVLLFKLSFAQRTDGQYWPCNPLTNATGACLPNRGLATSTYSIDFTQQTAIPQDWTISNYATIDFGPLGAEFTFAKRYDAPQLWTDFYIFFGRVKVVMQVANGTGIISSSVLISDDFDEIDFEFSGNNFGQTASTGLGQNNYFGKGITGLYDRGAFFSVASPQSSFHTYEVDWTPQSLTWSVDGTVVRILSVGQTDSGTHQFPQTPSKLQLGLWDGGDPSQNSGTRAWAGGLTDFSKVPYTMYVKSVEIVNMYPAAAYNYTDQSGRWQSIQLLQSDSSSLNATQTQSSTSVTFLSSSISSSITSSGSTSLGSTSSTSTSSTSTSSSNASSTSTTLNVSPSSTSASLSSQSSSSSSFFSTPSFSSSFSSTPSLSSASSSSFPSTAIFTTARPSTATLKASSSTALTTNSASITRTLVTISSETTKASKINSQTDSCSLTSSFLSSPKNLISSGTMALNSGEATNNSTARQSGLSSTSSTVSSGYSSNGKYLTSSLVRPASSQGSANSWSSDKGVPAPIQLSGTRSGNPSSSRPCSRRKPLISTWTTPSFSPVAQLASSTTSCTSPRQSSSVGTVSSGTGSDWTRWGVRHGRIPLFHAPGA